jgi:hypothetical protein
MKTLIATAFAAALMVGLAGPIATPTPANAAVAVVIGGKINGGVVISRKRLCRNWGHRHGKRHCRTWGWRHRVRHCKTWRWHHGRRGACRTWRYVWVWR